MVTGSSQKKKKKDAVRFNGHAPINEIFVHPPRTFARTNCGLEKI